MEARLRSARQDRSLKLPQARQKCQFHLVVEPEMKLKDHKTIDSQSGHFLMSRDDPMGRGDCRGDYGDQNP